MKFIYKQPSIYISEVSSQNGRESLDLVDHEQPPFCFLDIPVFQLLEIFVSIIVYGWMELSSILARP